MWKNRNIPSVSDSISFSVIESRCLRSVHRYQMLKWNVVYQYFGPNLLQLSHLFVLFIVNSFTLFALSILLIRTVWMLCANTTTIEGWEISRHRTLVRRAKVFGGFLDGPDGTKIRIRKQEFPYDIGIWKNMRDGMGSGNVSFSPAHPIFLICLHKTDSHSLILLHPHRSCSGYGRSLQLRIIAPGWNLRSMGSRVCIFFVSPTSSLPFSLPSH